MLIRTAGHSDFRGDILTGAGAGACHTVTHIIMATDLTIITGHITIMAGMIRIHTTTVVPTGMDTIMDITIIIIITDIMIMFTADTGIHVLRIPIIQEAEADRMLHLLLIIVLQEVQIPIFRELHRQGVQVRLLPLLPEVIRLLEVLHLREATQLPEVLLPRNPEELQLLLLTEEPVHTAIPVLLLRQHELQQVGQAGKMFSRRVQGLLRVTINLLLVRITELRPAELRPIQGLL